MSRIPDAFYDLPVEMRSSVCTAIRRIEGAGETPTNRRVRAELKAGGGSCYDARKLALLVRWNRQGLLPDRWDGQVDGSPTESIAARRRLPASKVPLPLPPAPGAEGEPAEQIDLAALRMSLATLSDPPYTEARLLDYASAAKKLLSLGAMTAAESAQHASWVEKGRKLMEAERSAPTEDPESVCPLTELGYAVADAFERLCSDRRRKLAVDYLEWLLRIDLIELPSYDPQGAL